MSKCSLSNQCFEFSTLKALVQQCFYKTQKQFSYFCQGVDWSSFVLAFRLVSKDVVLKTVIKRKEK